VLKISILFLIPQNGDFSTSNFVILDNNSWTRRKFSDIIEYRGVSVAPFRCAAANAYTVIVIIDILDVVYVSLTNLNNDLLCRMTKRKGFSQRLAEPRWNHISDCGMKTLLSLCC